MQGSILYCGDTELNGAAAYLAGLMTHWGWTFDYVPSHVPMTTARLDTPRSLLILSDYPAMQFSPDCQELALKKIEQGCGLLMIGGWESYHGLGGDWDGTRLGSALPVDIQTTDDRVNFPQSAWLLPTGDHEIAAGLPWRTCPPAIGGMNQVRAKAGATVVLEAHTYSIKAAEPKNQGEPVLSLTPQDVRPALVVGQHGSGRTASFLSDVAPHWVGGLVDWGLPRVTGQAAGGPAIEVGHDYAQLWKQLLHWTAASRTTNT
ncbi:glutamine amidotransferase [Schlesneria paludicola]|uniref:glutamine amidotransferase n=1 Tax=Schlesneria paludicola TaxID=360056 RepID=UPI00029AC538|nr:glutamine amidotransferase [Schlesneria paludicola]